MEARILSKDLSGPATRLARIPAGWGSGVAGAFTADVELFLIEGSVTVAGERIEQYGYGAVKAGQVIGGIRAHAPTVALVMTSAPVRYDTSAGGPLSDPLIGQPTTSPWAAVPELSGRYVRPLADGPNGAVWLSAGWAWANDDGPWHFHPSPEEVFVLEGELTVTERPGAYSGELHDGEPPGVEHRCGPGSYTFRLADRLHAGPGSHSERSLTFHRMLGPRTVTWVADEGSDL